MARTLGVAMLFALLPFGSALAQEAVARIISFEGTVEIGRDDSWRAAERGAEVSEGDRIRAAENSKVALLFRDDTVVHLLAGEFLIEKQEIDPVSSRFNSVLRLFRGSIRSFVSDYYQDPLARFDIYTATALAGVRGTDFVVTYDDETEIAEVVGLSGRIEVTGVTDPRRRSVMLGERQITTVRRGEPPTPPRAITEDERRHYILGMELIGRGSAESLAAGDPVVTAESVPAPDQADVVLGVAPVGEEAPRAPEGGLDGARQDHDPGSITELPGVAPGSSADVIVEF